MNKFRAIYVKLSEGNSKVVGVILLSAAWILLIRLFSPIAGDWDTNIQIDAAYRFTDGLGLTNAFFSEFNLIQPPTSRYLIHFPPGFSLLVSLLLSFDISIVVALKIIYGLSTVVGWIGWSIIGSRCLVGPIKLGTRTIPLHLIISAALPTFSTPSWRGTDIILWAGVPVVCLLLLYKFGSKQCIVSTITSAIVFTIMVFFRYAAGFLIIYVLLIVFYVDFPSIKYAFSRIFLFLSTCILTALPFLLYGWKLSGSRLLDINNLFQTHRRVSEYIDWGFLETGRFLLHKYLMGLSNLYVLLAIRSNRVFSKLAAELPELGYLFGLLFLSFLIVFLFFVLKYIKQCTGIYGKDILVVNTCLIVSQLLFGTLLLFIVFYSPLEVDRYYVPVRSCLIFVMYRVVSFVDFNRLLKRISLLLILVSVFFYILIRPVYHLTTGGSDALFPVFLEIYVHESVHPKWPSNSLLTIRSETAEFLNTIKLNDADVDSVFFVQEYPYYIAYKNLHRSLKFRLIPGRSFWQQAYLDKPTKVFFVVNYEGCPSICSSSGNFDSDDGHSSISELISLPNLKTIFVSFSENTRVMMSELPAGFHFTRGE